jgi:hypothetical protein
MLRTDAPQITWAMLSAAGIDTNNVHRNPDNEYGQQFTANNGRVRVAFGEQPDPEHICSPDEHPGWAYTIYDGDEQDATEFFEPEQLPAMLDEIAEALS